MGSTSPDLVDLSHAEVYRACQRAFFALGFPAGYDEDAAAAVTWLSALNLGGLEILCNAIPALRVQPFININKSYDNNGNLLIITNDDCGFLSSFQIIDSLHSEARTNSLKYCTTTVSQVRYPTLFIPIAKRCCKQRIAFKLEFDVACILFANKKMYSSCPIGDLDRVPDNSAIDIECYHENFNNLRNVIPINDLQEVLPEKYIRNTMQYRISVDVNDWRIIKELAAESFVPATDVSRTTGAGAQIDDND